MDGKIDINKTNWCGRVSTTKTAPAAGDGAHCHFKSFETINESRPHER
jgi:hypothetical protein